MYQSRHSTEINCLHQVLFLNALKIIVLENAVTVPYLHHDGNVRLNVNNFD